jgi:hypothetical protein
MNILSIHRLSQKAFEADSDQDLITKTGFVSKATARSDNPPDYWQELFSSDETSKVKSP